MNTSFVFLRHSFTQFVIVRAVSACTIAMLFAGAYFITVPPAHADAAPPAQPVQQTASDAEALAALRKMGAYLRSLKAFDVKAEATREEVLDDGQKLQFGLSTDLLLRAPDRMRAHVRADNFERVFFYDGKTFTLSAPKMNFYASVPAPGTLEELAEHLNERFDIEMPLADLFLWGKAGGESEPKITAAISVGDSAIEGVTCSHYAFRQEGLDWQIWIQKGDRPLPKKLIITTLTDEARPQFCALYTWNTEPVVKDSSFAFIPSSGSVKVALARGDDSVADSQK